MHGLIFRTLEAYVRDSFGPDIWTRALAAGQVDLLRFEAMLTYDAALLPKLLRGCEGALNRDRSVILEDLGTYLITRQNHASVRRLMRFGGDSFVELLLTLDDLPGRTRLAVPGLDLPTISVRMHTLHRFVITTRGQLPGFGYVLAGLLRAMADDYGALALLEHRGGTDGVETLEVEVVEATFAEDRGFTLADTPISVAL